MTPISSRYIRLKKLPMAISGGLMAFLVASCGPSKVSQCNTFVEVVNKEAAIADAFEAEQQELQQSFASQDQAAVAAASATIQDYAQQLDDIVQEVAALDLADETVADFQARYVDSQTKSKEGIIEIAQLMEQIAGGDITPDQFPAIEQQMTDAQNKITEAETEIGAIQTEYAAYCQ